MKKITFIFVGVIYVIAIVIVAFLGVAPEITNQTIEVTSIVIADAIGHEKGDKVIYPAKAELKDAVYTVDIRPEEEIAAKNEGLIWNDEATGIKPDYIITIRKFNTVADDPTWRDGPMHFNLNAKVLPDNATKKDLTYSIQTAAGAPSTKTEINSLGVITFLTKDFTSSITSLYIHMNATDNSGISSLIQLRVGRYKTS